MRNTMTRKIICVVVSILFLANDVCFGLGTMPGSTQPGVKQAMFDEAGRRIEERRGGAVNFNLGDTARGRDDGGRFMDKPGKNPDDAKVLLAFAMILSHVKDLLQIERFTADKYLSIYKEYAKRLGYRSPAKNIESALRTVKRDLHESPDSLVKQGYLRILSKRGSNGEFVYEITKKFRKVLDDLDTLRLIKIVKFLVTVESIEIAGDNLRAHVSGGHNTEQALPIDIPSKVITALREAATMDDNIVTSIDWRVFTETLYEVRDKTPAADRDSDWYGRFSKIPGWNVNDAEVVVALSSELSERFTQSGYITVENYMDAYEHFVNDHPEYGFQSDISYDAAIGCLYLAKNSLCERKVLEKDAGATNWMFGKAANHRFWLKARWSKADCKALEEKVLRRASIRKASTANTAIISRPGREMVSRAEKFDIAKKRAIDIIMDSKHLEEMMQGNTYFTISDLANAAKIPHSLAGRILFSLVKDGILKTVDRNFGGRGIPRRFAVEGVLFNFKEFIEELLKGNQFQAIAGQIDRLSEDSGYSNITQPYYDLSLSLISSAIENNPRKGRLFLRSSSFKNTVDSNTRIYLAIKHGIGAPGTFKGISSDVSEYCRRANLSMDDIADLTAGIGADTTVTMEDVISELRQEGDIFDDSKSQVESIMIGSKSVPFDATIIDMMRIILRIKGLLTESSKKPITKAATRRGRSADGRFMDKSGKNPDDAMIVIAFSPELRKRLNAGETITREDYKTAYEKFVQDNSEYGFESNISDDTIMRDLFSRDDSLCNRGILRVKNLEEAQRNRGVAYRFELKDKKAKARLDAIKVVPYGTFGPMILDIYPLQKKQNPGLQEELSELIRLIKTNFGVSDINRQIAGGNFKYITPTVCVLAIGEGWTVLVREGGKLKIAFIKFNNGVLENSGILFKATTPFGFTEYFASLKKDAPTSPAIPFFEEFLRQEELTPTQTSATDAEPNSKDSAVTISHPGQVKLNLNETQDIYSALSLLHGFRIEIIQPQRFGISEKMDRTIHEINVRNRPSKANMPEGEKDTITIRPYSNEANLEKMLSIPPAQGVKRIVITDKQFEDDADGSKRDAYLRLFTDLSVFTNVRLLNVLLPEGYAEMRDTDDEKTFHEARLFMIAILSSLVEENDAVGKIILTEMLKDYVEGDPKEFVENMAKDDEKTWSNADRLKYFLGHTVSLLKELIREFELLELRMNTLWVAA